MFILLYMVPHQVVLVLWILFEVALLSRYRDLECDIESFDELAGIYYKNF